MITFIVIIFIVLFIAYIVGTISKSIIQSTKTNQKNNVKLKPYTVKNISTDDKLLYKSKEIKSFEIHGINYTRVNDQDFGDFIGYAICEYNSHDQYAVSIYKDKNKLIGFVPKGNKRLNNSITEWHDKRIIVWGNLRFDEYYKKWFGFVYIPVGLDERQIKLIENFVNLNHLNQKLLSKKEFSILEYFQILENHNTIISYLDKVEKREELDYNFPRIIIPSLSKKLETEKEWEKLIGLEKYSDLINELSEVFKNSTLKRIEKAKKKCPDSKNVPHVNLN